MALRNGFIRKKVRSLTLGERIRNIRSERRLSLAEISKGTGIQTKYLDALEQGKFSSLPSLVYVHGFLRSYAKYLGEDPEKFIASFERERGIAHNVGHDEEKISRDLWRSPEPLITHAFTPRILLFACIGFLFFGIVWYVYSEVADFVNDPQLLISSPESGVKIAQSFVEVSGKTDLSTRMYMNDREILVDEMGNFLERVEIREGVNTITLRAVNAFDQSTEKTFSIIGDFKNVQEEEAQKEEESFIVGVSEGDPLNIEIRIDGETIFVGEMVGGEEKSFLFTNQIEIVSEDETRTYGILEGESSQSIESFQEEGGGRVYIREEEGEEMK